MGSIMYIYSGNGNAEYPGGPGELGRAAAKVLRRAVELLESHGWHQGWYVDEHGRLCSVGAIHMAACGSLTGCMSFFAGYAASAAANAVARRIGGLSVPRWNDTPGRTKKEVIDVLLAAADDAEKTGLEAQTATVIWEQAPKPDVAAHQAPKPEVPVPFETWNEALESDEASSPKVPVGV